MTPDVFWFRLPDDEGMLMSLKPGELRCYLVVTRAIQRDCNEGRISVSQVAGRAKISRKSAQDALAKVVSKGLLKCEKRDGTTAIYRLPFSWKEKDRSPTRDQSK